MLHPRAAGARGDGAAAPGGEDGQHVAGDDAGDAVRRRQDTHADGALSPGDGRRICQGTARSRRPPSRRGAFGRACGPGGGLRWQRLGSAGGAGGTVGRRRPSTRRRPGRRAARCERGDHTTGNGSSRPGVRGGRRAGPRAVRRGAELRQPLPPDGRSVPCLHPEPDRRDDGDHARGGGHQLAAQSGRDVGLRPGVAGQDHEGRPPRRQGSAGERRDRGQRGGAAASVRRHRAGSHPEEGVPGIRRLVLRTTGPAYRRSGRWSTAPRRRRRRGSICGRGSRPAIRSIRPRCRSSSGSGARCRSSSRPGAPWRCWPSGSPGRIATASPRPAPSR